MTDIGTVEDTARRRPYKRRIVYLATARRHAKLTQTELAERTGVSQPRICTLETTRDAKAAPETRAKLAYALGLDPALLRFGPNPRTRAALRRRWRR